MNAQELITEHLDIWTTAQEPKKTGGRGRGKKTNDQSLYGIKKLRELILDLAVRGKLVEQNPADEPASVLLEKIAAEKARLIKDKKIKKQKKLPEITEEEKPFDLPDGWKWVRFGNIAQHNSGKTLDKKRNRGQLREYITTSNLYWGKFELTTLRQMPILDKELEKCTARKGDLLICEGGEAGRAAVWFDDKGICFQNHVHRARVFCDVDPFYTYRLFEWLNATGIINQYRKGVGISNMSGKSLSSIVFPLSPIAEQHRIVAKVDELMALCDQLEQKQTTSNATHQTLLKTLLATLISSADHEAFTTAWERIATHFDILFTTEQSIDQLKQTILQLAVMGKLVPQNPEDEPASVLLEKIAQEKARLIKEGKIKKQKKLPEITEAEKSFALPKGWEWGRLGTTGLGSTGKTPSTRKHQYYDGATPFIGPGQITPGGNITTPDKTLTEEGCEYSVIARSGDILMVCIGGSIGKSAIVLSKIAFNQQLNCIHPLFTDSEYLKTALNAPYFQSSILDAATGSATPIINRMKWEALLVPLPPLSEQHRIVTKVDELMTLCDHLKSRLNDSQTTKLQLADTIVKQAVA